MQPVKYLDKWLDENANGDHYLFTIHDLRALYPHLSYASFKTLLSRAVRSGYLGRVCRGLYICERAMPPTGLVLFHAAALLRASEFNYISLETVLSDAGVISQVPMNWVSIMSSGRSSQVSCDHFGTIEFVHTSQTPNAVKDQLSYDSQCHLWRGSVALALRDMKAAHRNCDLIDWNIANEFI